MTSGLNLGVALEQLKRGARVSRAGWNGKGMWLYLLPAHPATRVIGHAARLGSSDVEAVVEHINLEPCIVMHTAQGTEQPGWLASQADMLAEDWCVL